MPIEIKELVIRATVDTGGADRSSAPAKGAEQKQEIVADCVEQVLEILRRKLER